MDAKTDIAAFVAEHQITGITRASVLGAKNFLHPSNEEETASCRQLSALLAHIAKLPHGFKDAPFSVVVEARTGSLPAIAAATPWIAAAVDTSEIEVAKTKLSELGLAPAAITLAATVQFGVIAASLAPGETALVLLPGENDTHLAWISADGAQALAVVPMGYEQIFEAVQLCLGLKFKAAAGKLFYNEAYDFSEAAPKIVTTLASAIQSFLSGAPATHLHVVGLIPAQAWLVNHLAACLKLTPWTPSASFAARLNFDASNVAITTSSVGTLLLASTGSTDAPWVQSELATQASKLKPITPAPVAKPVVVAVPPAAQPTAKPVAKTAPAVAVSFKAPPAAQPKVVAPAPQSARPTAKNKTGLITAAIGVGVVIGVFGIAAYFKRPSTPLASVPPPEVAAPATTSPQPAAIAAIVAPTPPRAPVIVNDDQFPTETRKFGNNHYRFEVSDKGFIQALSTDTNEILIESAASISLQGSYVGTDGRRKWFSAGGVGDSSYLATIKKSIDTGVTVFDIKIIHPRFELDQTFTCLPRSVKVSAVFTSINLTDSRGLIAAAYSVRLSPNALTPSIRMSASKDTFTYAMKSGDLTITFDNTMWSRDGNGGRQSIVTSENGTAFHFTDSTEPNHNKLTYEITIP